MKETNQHFYVEIDGKIEMIEDNRIYHKNMQIQGMSGTGVYNEKNEMIGIITHYERRYFCGL